MVMGSLAKQYWVYEHVGASMFDNALFIRFSSHNDVIVTKANS